jgi:cyclohexyl-isocyanide hydratase
VSRRRLRIVFSLSTSGGVTAGIDFALSLLAEITGDPVAQDSQLALEYAPAPPFEAGLPDSAPPAIFAAYRDRLNASRFSHGDQGA